VHEYIWGGGNITSSTIIGDDLNFMGNLKIWDESPPVPVNMKPVISEKDEA